MESHPDFADGRIPRVLDLPPWRLVPLTPDVVDEDFIAVTESARELAGLFGGAWPEGLTLDANRLDLAWHAREFTANRSFAWVIEDAGEAYAGCAYVYPAIGTRGEGKAYFWFRSRIATPEITAAFAQSFRAWLDREVGGPDSYPILFPGSA